LVFFEQVIRTQGYLNYPYENEIQGQVWWLNPIILITWEVKIERMAGQGQTRQNV
jgi:hypothetical protein